MASANKQARRTLWLIIAVCVAPVIAALFAFFVWRPQGSVAHGEIVSPAQAMPLAVARTLSGEALDGQLRNKWVMALRADAGCDDACRQALYYMRQVRTLQAAEMERVARLWVLDGNAQPDPALLAEHPGLLLVRDASLATALSEPGRIALIDPRGNLMMRFPLRPDPKGMVKDLQKLLKYSR